MVMNLKPTISKLKQYENRDTKKGYKSDAVGKAFKRHTLELLAKISKTKIKEDEEEVYVPQEAGKQSFKCSTCKGEGYIEEWDEKAETKKIIKDCLNCNGEGYNPVLVVDKRKKTKDKDLYYNDEY